ncbi:ferredoxin--NADP reductase [Buchnera aphidicola (Ceratovacuna keduensis)]|uniref:ferredoxin--NADP reductase n=1 Tax=Buchnera aphidicola TaxID=9 RepID=UPI0031B8A72B
MTDWIEANVIKIKKWKFPLFSIIINAKILPFIPGQFTKIAIFENEKKIQRAYSYVNSPKNKNLEFYIAYVKNGIITKKLYNLNPGNKIMISKKSFGFFTLKEIPKTKNIWMISTGTAIGPFLSILQNGGKEIKKFNRIILIHAVRYKNQFNYKKIIKKIKLKYNNNFLFQKIVSREKLGKNYLFGRIPELFNNNTIEKKINININNKNSHFMICGNPNMVKDTRKILIKKYKLKKNLRKKPGNITTENYW